MEAAEKYMTNSFWDSNFIGIMHKINVVPDWTTEYAKDILIPAKELVQACKELENKTGKRYFIVPGFKAFGPDLNCRDFQYEEGQLYVYPYPEDVMICNAGFHFCPNIADVFDYYPMTLHTPVALVYGIVSDDYEGGFYEFKSAGPSWDDRKSRIDKLCAAAIYISKILTHEEIIEGICKTLNIDKNLALEYDAPQSDPRIFPVWFIRTRHEPDSKDLATLFFNGISGTRCTICGQRVCASTQATRLLSRHPYRRVLIAGLPVCTSCICMLQYDDQIDQALTEKKTMLLTLDKFEYRRKCNVEAVLSTDRKRIDIRMTVPDANKFYRLQDIWDRLVSYSKARGQHIASMTLKPDGDASKGTLYLKQHARVEIQVSNNCGEALFNAICSMIVIVDEGLV